MIDSKNTYSSLNKKNIDETISASSNPDALKQILSNHFIGIDRPCSVSLGLGDYYASAKNKTESEFIYDPALIVGILQAAGIDAIDANSEAAANTNKFVIDNTGISTPFMIPEDALKATAEIYEVLKKHDIQIKGYALPLVEESLCKISSYKVDSKDERKNKKINLADELDTNTKAAEMLKERGSSAKEFIEQQIEASQNLPEFDVFAANKNNIKNKMSHLYRGGTLGGNAYAVASTQRSKDLAYASPDMLTALTYATGLEAGYESTSDDIKYGFIYEYERSEHNKFYADFGIENRNEEASTLYETPVFPHQNPVVGMYLSTSDGRVVKITDEKGKFISKEWEDFVQLHETHLRAGSEYTKQRTINQLQELDKGNISSYRKEKNSNVLDLSKCSEIESINLSQYEELILPEKISNLKKVKFSSHMKKLDLSKCDGINLSKIDLTQFEELKIPEKIGSLENVKFPPNLNIKTLDFSDCKSLKLKNVDLSKINVILPEDDGRVEIRHNVKFSPEYKLDLSNCKMGYVDGSITCAEIILPPICSAKHYIELPKQVKEVSTDYICSSPYGKKIHPNTKIIDSPDTKKHSIFKLKKLGLSTTQCLLLEKERFVSSCKSIANKISAIKNKMLTPKIVVTKSVEVKNEKLPAKEVATKSSEIKNEMPPAKEEVAKSVEVKNETLPAKEVATKSSEIKNEMPPAKEEVAKSAEVKNEMFPAKEGVKKSVEVKVLPAEIMELSGRGAIKSSTTSVVSELLQEKKVEVIQSQYPNQQTTSMQFGNQTSVAQKLETKAPTRTDAVKRGDVITLYDPTSKNNKTGPYQDMKHYTIKDNQLMEISTEEANKLVPKNNKAEKLDVKYYNDEEGHFAVKDSSNYLLHANNNTGKIYNKEDLYRMSVDNAFKVKKSKMQINSVVLTQVNKIKEDR